MANYPLVKLRIVFDTTFSLLDRLNAMELDFALSFRKQDTNPAYQYIPLFSSALMLVSAKNTFSKLPQTISLQRISQLPLALPSEEFSTTHFLMAAFRKRKLQPDIRIQTNDIPNLLDINNKNLSTFFRTRQIWQKT